MITKKELSTAIQQQTGLPPIQADRTLMMVFDEIMDRVKRELKERGISQIEGLGTITRNQNAQAPMNLRGIRRRGTTIQYNMVFDEIMD